MFYLKEIARLELLPLFPILEPLDLYTPLELGRMMARYFFADRAKIFTNERMDHYSVGHTRLAELIGLREFPSAQMRQVLAALIILPLCEMGDPDREKLMTRRLLREYNEAVRHVFPCRYRC